MTKGFHIVTEYENVSPFIGITIYSTVQDACNAVEVERGKRTWIVPVTVSEFGTVMADPYKSEYLVAENGYGVGLLKP